MASGKELMAIIRIAGKMDPSVTAAINKTAKELGYLKTKNGNFTKAANASAKSQKAFNNQLKQSKGIFKGSFFGSMLGNMAATALTQIPLQITNIVKSGLEYASSLTEVQNVVDVTFGKNAGVINAWSKNTIEKFGLGELAAKQYAGTLGAMLQSSGVSDALSAKMSTGLTERAGDMASFYNKSVQDVYEAIQSGMSGETKPLRQFGINMNIEYLDAFAKAQGKKKYSDMDQASKSLLRYEYILDRTAKIQGDFVRTQDTYANQTRMLGQIWTATKGKIAKGLTEPLAKGQKQLNAMLKNANVEKFSDKLGKLGGKGFSILMDFLEKNEDTLGKFFDGGLDTADSFLDVLKSVGDSLTPLLETGSNLLPSISTSLSAVAKTLDAIAPLLELVAKVLDAVLVPVLDEAAKTVSTLSVALVDLKAMLTGDWGNIKLPKIIAEGGIPSFGFAPIDLANMLLKGMKKNARGGFTNGTELAGEAGREAIIPMTKYRKRAVGLLSQAANELGVNVGGSNLGNITYAPVIQVSGNANQQDIESALRAGYEQFMEFMEEYKRKERRASYGVA